MKKKKAWIILTRHARGFNSGQLSDPVLLQNYFSIELPFLLDKLLHIRQEQLFVLSVCSLLDTLKFGRHLLLRVLCIFAQKCAIGIGEVRS